MQRTTGLSAFLFLVLSHVAAAYEYPLQFTPNPGYRGLVVAGYDFDGNTVVGNCSYYTERSSGGRGGHVVITHYNQTCTWSLYGNLLSIRSGEPAIPAPIAMKGAETIYANNGKGSFTGSDTKLPEGGFVNTPGTHYSWLTPNSYGVIPQKPYTITGKIVSNGDWAVDISKVQASALQGSASVKGTTCLGHTKPGATCTVTVLYDPSALCSETGLAYDTVTVHVLSDAEQQPTLVERFTIDGVVPCND